jgi:hypothetical protein
MSPKIVTTVVCLLLALNLVGTAINLSLPSRAAVAGLSAHQLEADPNFVRAARSIVQKCRVNVDVATVYC